MNEHVRADIRMMAPVVVAIAFIAWFVPSFFGSLWLSVFTSAAIYVLSSVGVGVLDGRLGLVSLTNYVILGAGGWFTLRLYHLWHLPFVNVLLGGAFAAVIGTLVGLPALRLRGRPRVVTLLAAGAFANGHHGARLPVGRHRVQRSWGHRQPGARCRGPASPRAIRRTSASRSS